MKSNIIEIGEPPCRRFQSMSQPQLTMNMMEAMTVLRDARCPRASVLKFLTKTNCKIDPTVGKVGPRNHKLLNLIHNQNHCLRGWQFGDPQYKHKQSTNNIHEILKLSTEPDQLIQKLENCDEAYKQKVQTSITYHEKYNEQLNEQFKLPSGRAQLVNKITNIQNQMMKLRLNQQQSSEINLQQQQLQQQYSQQYSREFSDKYSLRQTSKVYIDSQQMSQLSKGGQQVNIDDESDSIRQIIHTESSKNMIGDDFNMQTMSNKRIQAYSAYIRRVVKPGNKAQFLTQTASLHTNRRINIRGLNCYNRVIRTLATEASAERPVK